ncbi:methyl-CpG-binding domain protein 6 [Mustela putorius furo]|uniref:Methyl-CpG-binding domain protein 6 n=1 Tax=Mustela putorius furo TaxID=9669 RepID=A0A8U0NVQ1_MUSPF|nr:methyl-CpG-binding domain protein 6 [Mustela putorius furo]
MEMKTVAEGRRELLLLCTVAVQLERDRAGGRERGERQLAPRACSSEPPDPQLLFLPKPALSCRSAYPHSRPIPDSFSICFHHRLPFIISFLSSSPSFHHRLPFSIPSSSGSFLSSLHSPLLCSPSPLQQYHSSSPSSPWPCPPHSDAFLVNSPSKSGPQLPSPVPPPFSVVCSSRVLVPLMLTPSPIHALLLPLLPPFWSRPLLRIPLLGSLIRSVRVFAPPLRPGHVRLHPPPPGSLQHVGPGAPGPHPALIARIAAVCGWAGPAPVRPRDVVAAPGAAGRLRNPRPSRCTEERGVVLWRIPA